MTNYTNDSVNEKNKIQETNEISRKKSQESEDNNNNNIDKEKRIYGISSLLMPPSIRKKIEKVAGVQRSGSNSISRDAADAAARFYLLETTRNRNNPIIKTNNNNNIIEKNIMNEESFTARTEKPIKGVHLRELYRIDQEMRDMTEGLSSYSISEATITEMNDLEIYE